MYTAMITYGLAAWYNKSRQGTARNALSKVRVFLHEPWSAEAALSRMAKNGVREQMLLSKKAWTDISIEKHSTYDVSERLNYPEI